MRWGTLGWIAWALLIIGGINWGLVGLFGYDLVGAVFGGTTSVVSRIIFTLVGVAAVWQLFAVPAQAGQRTT